MSTSWSIRSKGDSRFGLIQRSRVGMDAAGLYTYGLFNAQARFRVNLLPVAVASSSEMHAFLSLHYPVGTVGNIAILEIGVTPDGRVSALAQTNGAAVTSAAGVVSTGEWHDLEVNVDLGVPELTILLDGAQVAIDSTGTPGNLVPPSGRLARLVLFNGRAGISSTDLNLSNVRLFTSDGATPRTVIYALDEKQGDTVNPTLDPDGSFSGIDLVLQAGVFSALSQSLGAASRVGILDSFEWVCETPYTKRAKPDTRFARRRIA